MSERFVDSRVIDLAVAATELRARRRALREHRYRNLTQRLRRMRFPRSALWVLAFYIALACCTALWWRWDVVGLSRLLMGTLLLFLVLLAISREVTWVPSRLDGASSSDRRRGGVLLPPARANRRRCHARLRRQRGVVLMRTSVTAIVCAAFAFWAAIGRADVWEFDRSGKILRAPDRHGPRTNDEPARPNPATRSSRSVYSAIYRPMAEGVAAVYARDSAVVAAGLSKDEFGRVFVALIDQESRFDPRARSSKGAQGLGQLMPETAALLGVNDATEPMANLHGAARYLTQQLDAFGRIDWALAAYNAGPHRVEQYGGVPPYRETRDYVARITAAADLAEPVANAPPPDAPRLEVARATSTPFGPEQGTVMEWTK